MPSYGQQRMKFRFQPLEIPDVILVSHEIFRDQRGFFLESFREEPFLEQGIPRFVQDNHARSTGNVLRGLHYQIRPAAIGKLVRCLRGRIFDVAVDIRKGSPTYAKWVGVELTDENCRMVYIPEGFAHAYCALTDECEVFYKTTGYYSPLHDRGFRWNDPDVAIEWPISDPVLSPKDADAPLLKDADNFE
jgi:dTDP-4-dehydrorhamnose 3,5-epimerase